VLADLIGRLPLLIASTGLMSVALGIFGCIAYYRERAVDAAGGADWPALMCVVLFVSAFSVGINPISWLLVGEIFPLEHRSVGSSASAAFSYAMAFVAVKTYVDLRQALGLSGAFWTYSIVAAMGTAYSLAFVPETKGAHLDEMHPRCQRAECILSRQGVVAIGPKGDCVGGGASLRNV